MLVLVDITLPIIGKFISIHADSVYFSHTLKILFSDRTRPANFLIMRDPDFSLTNLARFVDLANLAKCRSVPRNDKADAC